MIRNHRFLVIISMLAVAGLIGAAWVLWPRTAITRGNFERIRVGMTLAEVEHLLGGPSRDEKTGPTWSDESDGAAVDWASLKFHPEDLNDGPPVPPHRDWSSDRIDIRVEFDEDERVTCCKAIDVHRVDWDEGLLEKLRQWLRF